MATKNPWSQDSIDHASTWLRQYKASKNQTAAQKIHYQNYAKTYGDHFVNNRVIDPTKLSAQQERFYRSANPTNAYSKEKDMRYVRQLGDMIDQNKGVTSDQLKSYNDKIKKWNLENPYSYENQQKKQVNTLFDQQKASLAPQYAEQRNQVDVVNQQNVSKLRELMAAQGLSGSGEGVSAQVGLNSQRQAALNDVNMEQQQATNDLEAQRAQKLIDVQSQAKEWEYRASRDARRDAEWESQQKADRAWREYTFKNMSASEKAQLEWAKSQYGEDAAWRMYAMQYEGEMNKTMNQAQIDAYRSGFNGTEGGGGNYTKKASGSPNSSYQSHMSQAVKMGVPSNWVAAMTELVGRESSWNPTAKNPKSTAHGYGQFLNSTRANYEKKTGLNYSNPVHQLVMMAQYVKDRYGTPEKALAFWDKNKWY
ncbi:hypothetical protein [Fictibacillus sp. JL2B1089]|uniref:aggregation-promoting factor C-terminal-like domain-containing protein n=1 Tax=Fictibacillus sp. JL2B1089 TaxID=3399565 RepID=UPI003A89A7CD